MSCSCSGGTVATKYYLTENPTPRKNDLQRPAKGGSTPAFACQQENQSAKYNLLRKCGLLAHTSAAFLKNCCTEKLFICLRLAPSNYTAYATSNETKNRPSRNGFFSCSRLFFH